MDKIITAEIKSLKDKTYTDSLCQHDYGQTLKILVDDGLPQLPSAVEVQFSLREKSGDTETRVGTTVNGVTNVKIPDTLLKNNGMTGDYFIYAYIYLTDDTSGNTEYLY